MATLSDATTLQIAPSVLKNLPDSLGRNDIARRQRYVPPTDLASESDNILRRCDFFGLRIAFHRLTLKRQRGDVKTEQIMFEFTHQGLFDQDRAGLFTPDYHVESLSGTNIPPAEFCVFGREPGCRISGFW
jgi:hypothetical protein